MQLTVGEPSRRGIAWVAPAPRRSMLALIAAVVCLTPSVESRGVVPNPGTIVYPWLDGSTLRSYIYVKTPGEADARLIFDQPGFVWNASWSPDGARIVFDHEAIFVMNADGAQIRRLTDANDLQFGSHTWGPGPTEITFFEPGADQEGPTWVMDVDRPDSRRRIIRDGMVWGAPSWSPDGTRLAYSWRPAGAGGSFRLHVMDDDAGVVIRLTETAAYSPSWSPDATQLAFVGTNGGTGGDLYVIRARDGAAPRRVTNAPYSKSTPVWLADGQWIAYGTSGDVHVVNVATGETHALGVRKGVPSISHFSWLDPFRDVSEAGKLSSSWGHLKRP